MEGFGFGEIVALNPATWQKITYFRYFLRVLP